jgi:hypothetical protein
MKDDTAITGTERELRDAVLRTLRDADFRLDVLHDRWRKTGDPLAVWAAIAICSDQDREMPDWVRDYLAAAASRMTSSAGYDLRKALPAILGLGSKRGPRPVHDDQRDADLFVFASVFFYWIATGDSLDHALDEARRVLPPFDASADDLTLLRWLAREFGLADPPRSLDGWRKAIVSSNVRVSSKL